MKRIGAIALALAACTPAADTASAPLANTADPAALPTPELDGATALPGSWSFAASPAGATARFGEAGAASAFAIRCDAATRRIVFTRAAPLVAGAMLRLVTPTAAAAFAARAGTGGVEAEDPATDTFLDMLAGATGAIGVIVGHGPAATVPATPGIARVLAACRG